MTYTKQPTTPEEIKRDQARRFAAAERDGKKATNLPKALRAMARHGIGVDGDGKMVDMWTEPGAWGVVLPV